MKLKIIMNPPYGKGNPDLKILEKMLKDFPQAKIASLQPDRVAQDPLFDSKNSTYKRYKHVFQEINELEHLDNRETNKMFNISTGSLSIYTRDFSDKKFDHIEYLRDILGEGYDVSRKVFKQLEDSIAKHLQKGISAGKWGVKVAEIRGFGSGDNYDIVSLRNKPFSSEKEYKQNKFQKKDVTNKDKSESFVCFDDYESAENFIEYTRTNFVHFLVKIFKRDVHVPLSALPYMPTYRHSWTDQDLYKFFGLSKGEISTIESEVSTDSQ